MGEQHVLNLFVLQTANMSRFIAFPLTFFPSNLGSVCTDFSCFLENLELKGNLEVQTKKCVNMIGNFAFVEIQIVFGESVHPPLSYSSITGGSKVCDRPGE